jgi:hypothetical protein
LNNLLKIGMIGVLLGGLLAGCETSQTNNKEVNVNATKVQNNKSVSAKAINPKAWKDKSLVNGLEKTEFTPNAKGWVSEQLNIFRQAPDQKLLQAGYDKGYDYYLKADAVSNVGSYIRVEGVDIEKDFENLRLLAEIIKQETEHRSAGTGSKKKWKPISNRLQMSYDYMTKLLNDLDVAINKDGKGETFGVSHQLDGDKVKEMESFISNKDRGIMLNMGSLRRSIFLIVLKGG